MVHLPIIVYFNPKPTPHIRIFIIVLYKLHGAEDGGSADPLPKISISMTKHQNNDLGLRNFSTHTQNKIATH